MAGKQRYTPQQIIAALEKTKGLQRLAARELGCDRDTILNYIHRYPSVRAVAYTQRGELLDEAEMQLYKAILRGEPWAVILCLKTLGKDRGYVERREVTGKQGASGGGTVVQIQVEYARQRVTAHLAAHAGRRVEGAKNGPA
jgi:hypothetical protein